MDFETAFRSLGDIGKDVDGKYMSGGWNYPSDVSLRFVDLLGTMHQFNFPLEQYKKYVKDGSDQRGIAFDGSSIRMWKGIEKSDMLMVPDYNSFHIDPITNCFAVFCFIRDPRTNKFYDLDPRNVAQKAEEYLLTSKKGDRAYFGPESEFFIFDSVEYHNDSFGASFVLTSEESWNKKENSSKIPIKGGYAPCAPMDKLVALRQEIVKALDHQVGALMKFNVERHHHEVASAGQCEINYKYDTLLKSADKVILFRYLVRNIAAKHGMVASFMPKPVYGDNGSGMHVHMSIFKDDNAEGNLPKNRFAPKSKKFDIYGGLSQTALHAIGGILVNAGAITAFANPTTNSFKRLVPGYEAPVNLTYAAANRSAAVRIPFVGDNPNAKRFEYRCPDGTSNPYLAFSALLISMVDGITNNIEPGDPNEIDLFSEKHNVGQLPFTLGDAMDALELQSRHDKLFIKSGVFSEELISKWIEWKRKEIAAINQRTHPYEFEMYHNY